jgi:transcriptional regulator with XRE-family HTH domain
VPDIGNTLREARIRRGLTITDVENVTKIRHKYLEALEENDFEVLPGPTVVKGFLRSYASFLKLDPDVLLAEYRGQYEGHKDEIGALRTEMAQQPRTRTSTERKQKRTRRTQRGYVAAGVVAVVVIILLAWLSSGRGQAPATIDGSNLATTTTAAASTTLAVETTSTSSTIGESTSTTAGVATTTGENVTMVLSVSEGSCWLVVRADNENGAELYAGTLSAGGKQTFDTAKRYWVIAGIPEALTVTVNGTPYSLTGGAGSFVVTETGVERVQQAE